MSTHTIGLRFNTAEGTDPETIGAVMQELEAYGKHMVAKRLPHGITAYQVNVFNDGIEMPKAPHAHAEPPDFIYFKFEMPDGDVRLVRPTRSGHVGGSMVSQSLAVRIIGYTSDGTEYVVKNRHGGEDELARKALSGG
jgi:hypothetical protein